MRYLKGVPENLIKEKYRYDPTSPSGLVHLRPNRLHGKRAGTLTFLGYWKVGVKYNRKKFDLRAHRVIFLLCTDVDIDTLDVDHIDNNRANNNIENLRACTKSQNNLNRKKTPPTNTGIKGLIENTKHRHFAARVTSERKSHRKIFRYSENSTSAHKEEVKAEAIAWLRETRERLHGDYANHGGEGAVPS